jgi:hypothetical protein
MGLLANFRFPSPILSFRNLVLIPISNGFSTIGIKREQRIELK